MINQEQSNTDKLYYAYEQLHSVLSRNQKSPNFDVAVKNFLLHSNSNPTMLEEYYLLVSLLEFIHYEAPKKEQNLFMVVELIEAGIKEEGEEEYESNLDRLFETLREENAEHIAIRHYDTFKSISGDKASNVVASCRRYFSAIGNERDIFRYINDNEDIKILAKIIIRTFAENKHSSDKLYNYFTKLYDSSRKNKKMISVSDINIKQDGIDKFREFYTADNDEITKFSDYFADRLEELAEKLTAKVLEVETIIEDDNALDELEKIFIKIDEDFKSTTLEIFETSKTCAHGQEYEELLTEVYSIMQAVKDSIIRMKYDILELIVQMPPYEELVPNINDVEKLVPDTDKMNTIIEWSENLKNDTISVNNNKYEKIEKRGLALKEIEIEFGINIGIFVVKIKSKFGKS